MSKYAYHAQEQWTIAFCLVQKAGSLEF
jgi:hypothetical protein